MSSKRKVADENLSNRARAALEEILKDEDLSVSVASQLLLLEEQLKSKRFEKLELPETHWPDIDPFIQSC